MESNKYLELMVKTGALSNVQRELIELGSALSEAHSQLVTRHQQLVDAVESAVSVLGSVEGGQVDAVIVTGVYRSLDRALALSSIEQPGQRVPCGVDTGLHPPPAHKPAATPPPTAPPSSPEDPKQTQFAFQGEPSQAGAGAPEPATAADTQPAADVTAAAAKPISPAKRTRKPRGGKQATAKPDAAATDDATDTTGAPPGAPRCGTDAVKCTMCGQLAVWWDAQEKQVRCRSCSYDATPDYTGGVPVSKAAAPKPAESPDVEPEASAEKAAKQTPLRRRPR